MADTRTQRVMSGGEAVDALSIKGKPYIDVATRVKLAVAREGGYEILDSEIVPLGETGRLAVRVRVRVGDKLYVGTSEVKLNAPNGTADHDAPVECAETSAVGRALGFANIGVIDSIASADEMRAIQRPAQPAQASHAAHPGHGIPAPASAGTAAPAAPARGLAAHLTLDLVRERAYGLEVPPSLWETWMSQHDSDPVAINDAISRWQTTHRPNAPATREPTPIRPAAPGASASPASAPEGEPAASDQQVAAIRKLCAALGRPESAGASTAAEARAQLTELSAAYARMREERRTGHTVAGGN